MKVRNRNLVIALLGFVAWGCSELPTQDVTQVTNTADAKPPWAGGGGGGGNDGGGDDGGGDDGSGVTADLLLSRSVSVGGGKKGGPKANRSYSILKMDLAGNQGLVQSEADETGFDSLEPRWAPDGNRFSFVRVNRSTDEAEVAVGHLDGSPPAALATAGRCTPSTDWSPVALDDGVERIAYVAGPCLAADLWVVKPDGGASERLSSTADVQRIVWSSDGTRILAHTRDPTNGTHGLRLYDIDCGAGECAVTAAQDLDLSSLGLTDLDSYGQMDAARSSDRILLTILFGDAGPADLAILDLTGTPTLTYVTQTPADEYAATWGPADEKIAFTRYDGSTAVWILDLATGAETLLSDQYPAYGMDWGLME